jgi:transposase-like protein
MSKRKITSNEKLNAVLRYLDGNASQNQIARTSSMKTASRLRLLAQ